MNDSPISKLVDALYRANGRDPKRVGKGLVANCPVHDDQHPSLSIREGEDGRVLINCHTGCDTKAVVAALGLEMRDLFSDRNSTDKTPRRKPKSKVLSVSESSGAQKTFVTAKEAIDVLERKHGKRSAFWIYKDARGNPVSVVLRWDTAPSKYYRPVSLIGSGWEICGMPEPRMLYHLPELSKAKDIYVCEGEKAADALCKLGLTSTTSPHGAESATKADWHPLAGKIVYVVPDNDLVGKKYGECVVACLGKLTPPPKVKIVILPDLPAGGDAADHIETQRTTGNSDDQIRLGIEKLSHEANPIVPNTVAKPGLSHRCFPVEVLPDPLRSFVVAASKAIGCAVPYVVLPLLSALAAAIGNTRRIQLKDGWAEPAIIWTVNVGESGTLKSPPFRLAAHPVLERQNKELKHHEEQEELYRQDMLHFKKKLAKWNHSKTSEDPPTQPDEPKAKRFITEDTTIEGLVPILLNNPRGILLARDEMAGWVGSFDRYVGGKGGADLAHWLSIFNGAGIIVDRKTGQQQTIYVPSANVSVTGGVQPRILERILSREYRESGLAARLLMAWPPRTSRQWTEEEIPLKHQINLEKVFDFLYALQGDADENGDLRPLILELTPQGKTSWIRFYNSHAAEQEDLTGDLAATWSKLEAYAARLALVVHLVRSAADDPTLRYPDAIDEVSVEAGIALTRWFGHEAKRIYAMFGEGDDDSQRRQLAELIERKGGMVTVRDWQRARSHKTSSDAESELADLAEVGYGFLDDAVQVGPGRPSKVFKLHADNTDTDKTTDVTPPVGVLSVPDVSEEAYDDWREV